MLTYFKIRNIQTLRLVDLIAVEIYNLQLNFSRQMAWLNMGKFLVFFIINITYIQIYTQ